MGAKVIVQGNLGKNPELKYPVVSSEVGNETKAVCEFSIYQSHNRFNKETSEYEDIGGFWIDVSIWGKEGESLAKVLCKGYPVKVEGEMYLWPWVDSDGEKRITIRVESGRDGVSLMLYPVENVQFRQPSNELNQQPEQEV